ncbi:MAG: phosphate signaling complex protein PhoU [Candidatus Polarisedimenticolaceae bacterium]|nr:phosphate signaling complex protein PhoU [Candidatus Polarisedimenticolaceae bacterium]
MNEMTEGHIVSGYNNELTDLHQTVLQMRDLVREQIKSALKSLQDEDVAGARAVIRHDQKINDLDIRADDAIIHLIAKRQPVAKDLREVLAVGKIVSDLERMGDQARWIARLTIRFYEGESLPPHQQLLTDISKMAAYVDIMVDEAITAFDQLDLQRALEVMHKDQALESEFKSALRRLSTYLLEDARNVGHIADVVLALRALERIGGHAKNIAGHVVFLIRGKDMRHATLEAITEELERR